MTRLHGILAATATPLTVDDHVDQVAIRRVVDSLIDAGVHGLVPAGTTGEFANLTLDERQAVVEGFLGAARGRVPVVPHVGAIATREARMGRLECSRRPTTSRRANRRCEHTSPRWLRP